MSRRRPPVRDWTNDRLARVGSFIASTIGLGFMFIWSLAVLAASIAVPIVIVWFIFLR